MSLRPVTALESLMLEVSDPFCLPRAFIGLVVFGDAPLFCIKKEDGDAAFLPVLLPNLDGETELGFFFALLFNYCFASESAGFHLMNKISRSSWLNFDF